MKIVTWEDFLRSKKEENRGVAMSIGVFDGVHKGHLSLIRKILSEEKTRPWIVTFKVNPSRSLYPDRYPGDLMSTRHKLEKLDSLGIASVVIIDFSGDFGKLRGADFFSLIREHCELEYLAVGEDFHCGHGMDTSAKIAKDLLEREGVRVDIVPPVFQDGHRISSTRIRGMVFNGDFSSAEKMLGHPYKLDLAEAAAAGKSPSPRLERDLLRQVIPKNGSFSVVFEEAGGFQKEGSVDIDETGVSWHYDGNVEAITFV